jgi:D-arabinose 1-dehydrogenase-like Zn-dependent alcohol dehydrogenase
MRSHAAIRYEYGRPWTIEECELDRPRAGEVLLRLAATGLCHSDEHLRQGKLAPPSETLRSLGLPAIFADNRRPRRVRRGARGG